jgi:hypothetical protein
MARGSPVDGLSEAQTPWQYEISGTETILPAGVPLNAPWRVLSAAYGPGSFGTYGSSVDVRFCRLLNWRFIYLPKSALQTHDQEFTTGDGVLRGDAQVAILRITPKSWQQPAGCKAHQ